jgi:macrolide transport system ATP-binding/permease protein
MGTLWQDVKYAMRQLRKSPGFMITAVLTLALGIGANTAIFTLVNAVLLKNLPVADPKTLVRLGEKNDCCVGSGGFPDNDSYSLFPTETYDLLRKNVPEFEDLAAIQAGFEYRPIIARRDGAANIARSMQGEFVSGNYFRTFGLSPVVGRMLTDADDVPGAPMMAVMSYEAWKTQYNSDPSVVGTTFWVNTKPVTVTGIAPRGFYGDRLSSAPPDFYLPIHSIGVLANANYYDDPGTNWLDMIGRVKPGTNMAALQEKVSALLKQEFASRHSFSGTDGQKHLQRAHIVLTPGGAGITEMQNGYAAHLHLLMWVSGLVLLIACANIANLLLVRGMRRKAELSLRIAIGAKRGRVMRQLLTESVVLAFISSVVGLIVAYAGTRMLLTLAFPGENGVPIHATPSVMVMLFACGLALATGVLFGVAPAWIASNAEPLDALRGGSRTTTGSAGILQRGLVIGQAALSLVLLVGAGLFAQNLSQLEHMDMNLDATNRYIVHFNPQGAGYLPSQTGALYRTIEERFHGVPGIVKVGISTYTPMEDDNNGWSIYVEGNDKPINTSNIRASAEYFDSVGTRVVMGRGITSQDTSTSHAVMVVNQEFVKQAFKPGENPIGQHIGENTNTSGDFEIVGVVEDTTYTDVRYLNHAMVFHPLSQRTPSNTQAIDKDTSLYVGAIVIQTAHPMSDMESIARRTLAGINPNLAVNKFQTFDGQIADRFTQERLLSRLTILFGGLALLLAAIGLYGVTAYTVARRVSEIGIRIALGAERSSVVAMVMRGVALQTMIGLAIGAPFAVLCVRFVKSQLYNITAVNLGILGGSVAALTAAVCIAGLIPARRAASIQPMEALRAE